MSWGFTAVAVSVAGQAYGAYQTNQANKKAAANARDQALTDSVAAFQDKVTSYTSMLTDQANAEQQFIQATYKNKYESSLSNALANIQSTDILNATDLAAGKINAHAREIRASQIANNAGNGVLVGEGTSQAIEDRTTELAMQDTLATLFSGARDAFSTRLQGQFALKAGEEANNAAVNQLVSDKESIALRLGSQQTGANNRQTSINKQLSSTLDTISARNSAAMTGAVTSLLSTGVSAYGKYTNKTDTKKD